MIFVLEMPKVFVYHFIFNRFFMLYVDTNKMAQWSVYSAFFLFLFCDRKTLSALPVGTCLVWDFKLQSPLTTVRKLIISRQELQKCGCLCEYQGQYRDSMLNSSDHIYCIQADKYTNRKVSNATYRDCFYCLTLKSNIFTSIMENLRLFTKIGQIIDLCSIS